MTTIPTIDNAPGADPLSVAHALLAAENAHDVDAAVALFLKDATVTLAIETRTGYEQIRAWQQELADGHFHMEVVGTPEVQGNKVRFSNRLDLDMFKQMGLGTVEGFSEAIVENGRITSYTFGLTPESAARLQKVASSSPSR